MGARDARARARAISTRAWQGRTHLSICSSLLWDAFASTAFASTVFAGLLLDHGITSLGLDSALIVGATSTAATCSRQREEVRGCVWRDAGQARAWGRCGRGRAAGA